MIIMRRRLHHKDRLKRLLWSKNCAEIKNVGLTWMALNALNVLSNTSHHCTLKGSDTAVCWKTQHYGPNHYCHNNVIQAVQLFKSSTNTHSVPLWRHVKPVDQWNAEVICIRRVWPFPLQCHVTGVEYQASQCYGRRRSNCAQKLIRLLSKWTENSLLCTCNPVWLCLTLITIVSECVEFNSLFQIAAVRRVQRHTGLTLHFYRASICGVGLGSRNSVRLSIRPSVCHTRASWQN